MRNSHKTLCGVPSEHCTGGGAQVNKDILRAHSTAEEAFACHYRYLVSQGYIPHGKRQLIDPVSGYIRVLTRPGKFGSRVRVGKNESNQDRRKTFDRVGGTVLSL